LNPLNDYAFTGGGFLRYNYFIALALALALHREGRRVATGIGLALAAAFRIFPLAFLVGLLACDLLAAGRRERLRRHARLYGAAAATLTILVASTSFVPTPSGDNPWLEQLRTVGARNAVYAPNGISLRFPFLYSGEHDVDAAIESARNGGDLDWLAETQRTFERRIGGYLAALAVLGGLALRSASRSRDAEAFFLGLVAIYGALILSHYYYCLLALIPLMFREDPRVMVGVAVGFALLTVTAWVPAVRDVLDFRYAVFSVEVGLGLTAILAWQGFTARSEPRGVSA
jgi:hypothetical protein